MRWFGLVLFALLPMTVACQQSGAAKAELVVGSPAPAIALQLHDGRDVALKDLRGSNVLVYFYPKDDTPG